MAVAAIIAISATAQETVKKVRLYKGNEIVAEQNYDELDSIVFADITTPEPQAPDTTPANPNFQAKAFTINSNGDQVYFSQGNLQYQASTNTWRFALNQYDVLGSANKTISSTNEGWIDLFGWGASGYNNTANDPFAVNYQPWSSSNSRLNQTVTINGTEYKSDDYNYYGYGPSIFMLDKNLTETSANYDWGVFNAISNGGGQAGMWRTLTRLEWEYIFSSRPLAQYLHSQATVCGVHGYVLLPDDFILPDGLSWSPQSKNWNTNTYDLQAWSAMEAVGAVFLPAAGHRYKSGMYDVGSYGYYWSTSYYNLSEAYYLGFYYGGFGIDDRHLSNMRRNYGFSVRLVRLCSE